MWKPGIKIGPGHWQDTLTQSQAEYCEVWYRADRERDYDAMFAYLEEHCIKTGLHYWAVLEGNIMPNLAYPDPTIWKPTLTSMQKTIATAAQHRFSYVNIHVGNAGLVSVFLDEYRSALVKHSEVAVKIAEKTFLTNMFTLQDFAKRSKVLLIVETIPPFEPNNWYDPHGRTAYHRNFGLSNHFVEALGKDYGIAINNDISHTAAECTSSDRSALWTYLLERTRALAPYTRLMHINTLREPFNGTDSHDGILDTDFERGVFPTKPQLHTLLHLFANRDDVWLINEPHTDHVANYRALCAL